MNRWMIIFEDGGEVIRKSLQDAQQTVEDHGRGGIIVPMMPADDACQTFTAQHAMAAIDALCCYAKERVAKARKRQYSSDSAEIQTAIDRADYVLSHAEGIKAMLAAAQQPQASAEELARLTHERNVLGQAIADMAVKLGIANGEVPISGPMLLMLCEDIVKVFAGKNRAQASAEDFAWIERAVAVCVPEVGDAWQRIRAALNQQAGLVEALEFYADPCRYHGPNQKPFFVDKYAPEGFPYMIDVTRDGGDIARAALAAVKGVDRG